ncbi:MAG: hypothetical protein PHP22_12370, partial [Oscillospiraceae bacterium]|nr:hypothetical protein [Oscillospiraceae bacterium]
MKYEEIRDLYNEFERRCPPEEIETSQGLFTVYSAGQGERTLLFLPGGTGRGGVFFPLYARARILRAHPDGRL